MIPESRSHDLVLEILREYDDGQYFAGREKLSAIPRLASLSPSLSLFLFLSPFLFFSLVLIGLFARYLASDVTVA